MPYRPDHVSNLKVDSRGKTGKERVRESRQQSSEGRLKIIFPRTANFDSLCKPTFAGSPQL